MARLLLFCPACETEYESNAIALYDVEHLIITELLDTCTNCGHNVTVRNIDAYIGDAGPNDLLRPVGGVLQIIRRAVKDISSSDRTESELAALQQALRFASMAADRGDAHGAETALLSAAPWLTVPKVASGSKGNTEFREWINTIVQILVLVVAFRASTSPGPSSGEVASLQDKAIELYERGARSHESTLAPGDDAPRDRPLSAQPPREVEPPRLGEQHAGARHGDERQPVVRGESHASDQDAKPETGGPAEHGTDGSDDPSQTTHALMTAAEVNDVGRAYGGITALSEATGVSFRELMDASSAGTSGETAAAIRAAKARLDSRTDD